MFHSYNLHHPGERWLFELRYVQLSGFNAGYDQELAGFWSKFCIVVRRCFMSHPIKGGMIGCDSNICRILHINIMWTTTRRSFSMFPNQSVVYARPCWFCCSLKPINIVVSEPIQSLSASTWLAHQKWWLGRQLDNNCDNGDRCDGRDDHYDDADTLIMCVHLTWDDNEDGEEEHRWWREWIGIALVTSHEDNLPLPVGWAAYLCLQHMSTHHSYTACFYLFFELWAKNLWQCSCDKKICAVANRHWCSALPWRKTNKKA